jgi:hypothetical protein
MQKPLIFNGEPMRKKITVANRGIVKKHAKAIERVLKTIGKMCGIEHAECSLITDLSSVGDFFEICINDVEKNKIAKKLSKIFEMNIDEQTLIVDMAVKLGRKTNV